MFKTDGLENIYNNDFTPKIVFSLTYAVTVNSEIFALKLFSQTHGAIKDIFVT